MRGDTVYKAVNITFPTAMATNIPKGDRPTAFGEEGIREANIVFDSDEMQLGEWLEQTKPSHISR